MFPAFLASLFFALNAACANRSSRAFGAGMANLGRLLIGGTLLGLFAHLFGGGVSSVSLTWFLVSGAIGMGMGDLGTYAALPLLGSRLTMLITQCLAAPIAALGEWLWLGTKLTPPQVIYGLIILSGVVIGIAPSRKDPPKVAVRPLGFLFGLVAAAGQGIGALLSRKGVNVAESFHESAHNAVFGLTSAYQRALGGLVFVLLWLLVMRWLNRAKTLVAPATPEARRTGRKWMLANGIIGPIGGMGCYQWALATTPSGIVLSVAAATPLLAIPVAYWLEGDRPSRRAITGGVVAVSGCVCLAWAR